MAMEGINSESSENGLMVIIVFYFFDIN